MVTSETALTVDESLARQPTEQLEWWSLLKNTAVESMKNSKCPSPRPDAPGEHMLSEGGWFGVGYLSVDASTFQ